MTLTINIPAETEQRLKSEAARQGIDEVECVQRLIEQSLPPAKAVIDQRTLDLFAQWEKEDQTDDSNEIARRNREFEELKDALNRNRVESGGPNARKVFP